MIPVMMNLPAAQDLTVTKERQGMDGNVGGRLGIMIWSVSKAAAIFFELVQRLGSHSG